jgi:hypothetical protein
VRFARVRREHADPSCVRDDRRPPACRQRLPGQGRDELGELVDPVDGQHAGLPEQRVTGHARRGRGRGVRRRGPLPGRGAARPDRHHRHTLGQPSGEAGELARVAERLQMQHRHPGPLVAVPPQQHVVAADVVLVPRRHRRRHAQTQPAQLLLHRDRDPAGLGDQPDVGGCRFGERGVELHRGVGVDDAEAVRPDHPHVMPADRIEQARGQRGLAGQPRADHQQRAHPPAPALLGHLRYRRRGNAEHREVDRLGQLVHRPKAVDAAHPRRMRVHRDEATRETGPNDVAQYGVAYRVRPAARTHDQHRPRREDRSQAADVRPFLACRERGRVPAGRSEVELDGDLGAVAGPPHRQPDVGQNLPHTLVLGQHVRDEAAHTAAPRAGGQVLQQERSDAECLLAVGHGQRDLRRRGIGARAVALRHTDQLVTAERPSDTSVGPRDAIRSSAGGRAPALKKRRYR